VSVKYENIEHIRKPQKRVRLVGLVGAAHLNGRAVQVDSTKPRVESAHGFSA
jgi:hypothetical protein